MNLDPNSFDDGTGDGIVNQFYVPGSGTDNTLTVFNDGVVAATGTLLSIEIRTDTNEFSTGVGTFKLTGAVGNDTTIFDEINTVTAGAGVVDFTLGVFGYDGNPFGVGDAALFRSTGHAAFDAPTVGLTGAGPFVVAVEGGDYVTRDQGSGNAEVSRVPIASVSDLYVNGSAGNDTLNVDFSNGAFPVFYNGGAGDDALAINGGSFGTVTYGADGPTSGGIEFGSGGSTITYTGLEPIFDNTSATNRVFTFSGAVDNITLSDDGTPNDGMSRIAAPGTAETVDFMNPTDSIQINAGDGGDTVTLAGLDAVGMPSSRNVNGDGGADILNASGFANGGWGFDGGAGADTITGTSVTDVVFWEEGGGNDNIDLGPSSDNLIISGNDTLADNVVINPNGSGFLVQRTNLTPVTLTVANVTDLEINGGGGDDLAIVNALPGLSGTLALTLNGGEGNDEVDLSALPDPKISVVVDGQNGNDSVVVAAGGDADDGSLDDFILFMNGSSNAQLDVGNLDVGFQNPVFESGDTSGSNKIVVNGSTDPDILVVDFMAGNPIPDGGVFFNGGAGANPDEIELENSSSFSAITYSFTNASDGSIDLDGDTITFTGLELPIDFGDAPDTGVGTGAGNYQTLQTDGGASHRIVTGIRLGAEVDGEDGTLQNATAGADDVDGVLPDGEPDDEDGVLSSLDLLGTIGASPTVTLLASNRSSNVATLSGWIDYNGDGVFDNVAERAQITVPAGTTDERFILTFSVVPDGATGTTYARFRLSTDAAAASSTGAASDGEVEDYVFSITTPSDSTVDSFLKIPSGANGGPTLNGGDIFGNAVASLGDLDGDGVTDLAVGAYGDNTGGSYSGAVHVLFLNADGSVKSFAGIDSNTNNGPSLSGGDQFGRSVAALGDLDGDGVVDLAVGASRDDTGGGAYSDRGAVHVLLPIDYGDAPDNAAGTGAGNYKTTLADGGPSHMVVAGLFLGDTVDIDDGTLQNATANADDTEDALPDDEDGVLSALDLAGTIGAAPTVTLLATNTTGTAGTLSGWIDYNSDGVFDNAAERAQIAVPDATTDGRFTLTFPAVPKGFTGNTYARFRLSTDAAAADSTGAASDGEVEDYVFSITAAGEGLASSFLKIASDTNGGPTLTDNFKFGTSVASLGDLDGDGVNDVAVGSLDFPSGGAVHVLFLKADGSVRDSVRISHETNGGPTLTGSDAFGSSVTLLGDLDGDGINELAVGANTDRGTGVAASSFRGAVHVLFLNADGTVRDSTKIGDQVGGGPTLVNDTFFGQSVTSLGDLDGDGVTDLAVGAEGDGTGGSDRGAVYVMFLNADGTVRESTKIAHENNGGPTLADFDDFGRSVSLVGDLDGDGIQDLAVGADHDDTGGTTSGANRGAVYVLFLKTDGTVRELTKIAHATNGGPVLDDGVRFGSSVASLGDLDGDGVGDLGVGAHRDYTGGFFRGALHVLLLNADGTVRESNKIAHETGGGPTLADVDSFGGAVTSLGDLDGDGVVDLAVGAKYDDTGGNARGAVHVLFLTRKAGFTLNKTTATVSEDGTTTTDSFTVVLDVQPTGDVVIDLSLSANPDAALDETSLTFTNANWDQAQTVNVTGLNDDVDDGDEQTTVTVSVNGAASDDTFDALADQIVTVTTTDDDESLPGNVDGDGDFDANDSFLVQLVLLSGTDAQINQSKGSSTLTATEIRAKISSLGSAADVDGDGDTDANDAFLIHLVKLSGTNTQIDLSKGSSPLTAAEIRTNVSNLGGGAAVASVVRSPEVLQSVLAAETDHDDGTSAVTTASFLIPSSVPDLFSVDDENDLAAVPPDRLPEVNTESVWEDFRDWIDAI
ncbi:MAG: hypothetical protein GY878_17030 [Fuerstiella sp.]|nr:hypothetical protein [Fuerstiella sp.]